ncbi:MAG: glycosyl hydrolase [Verrucomicrobiae bacterium]
MKMTPLALLTIAIMGACFSSAAQTIPPPAEGRFYHGCYPGGITGEEDDITVRDVQNYEKVVGQNVAWVYFSNNWYADRRFPIETATWIRKHGAIPYIRLMLRSRNHAVGKPEREFTLQSIIDGKFDNDLKAWGRAAGAFGSPLIVEYGTEVNGEWFGWNGKFHGGNKKDGFGDPGKADGPERFVAAYRHIADTVRASGAANITWVFHVDASQSPEAAWNRFENYYPGPDYAQWIGVSCYGPQKPTDEADEIISFRDKFDPVYARVVKLAPDKPVIIPEFGCTSGNPHFQAEDWAQAALNDLLSGRWPNVRGFSWWNERWENDDTPAHNTTMRVQDNPALGRVFMNSLNQHAGDLVKIGGKSPQSRVGSPPASDAENRLRFGRRFQTMGTRASPLDWQLSQMRATEHRPGNR